MVNTTFAGQLLTPKGSRLFIVTFEDHRAIAVVAPTIETALGLVETFLVSTRSKQSVMKITESLGTPLAQHYETN